MNSHHAVFELAAISVVLSRCRGSAMAAFMDPGFINQTNRIGMKMFLGECDCFAHGGSLLLLTLETPI